MQEDKILSSKYLDCMINLFDGTHARRGYDWPAVTAVMAQEVIVSE
jgi:hypothetical protein